MITQTSFRAFSIKNLAEHTVDPAFSEPWYSAPAIPSFPTREAYKAWMSDPTSTVPLFSLVEGLSPNLRISHTNNPHYVHGVICDYDTPLTDTEVQAGLKRIRPEHPLFAYNRTRRGGIRLVFRFERPVHFYGKGVFKLFMQRVKKELRLTSLFPGLDEECLTKPDQTYAAGDKWFVNSGSGFIPAVSGSASPQAYIRTAALWLWLSEAFKRTDDFDGASIEIPLSIVETEMQKRFPGRWSGSFVEGARGVRFWDPTADNPTAAIVRKEGMTAFTGDKGFMSWKDIFGREFVERFLQDKHGKVLVDMFCDSQKRYYRQLKDETWDVLKTEHAKRHLKVAYGLSDSVEKGAAHSEIDQVLHRLETMKRVEGALPFPHDKRREVEFNGSNFLNISNTKLMTAALDPQEWGENFPWLADFATGLAKDKKNLDVLLAEASRWIKSCHTGCPVRGHVVFIAGPPGTGKTFWSRQVLGRMIGGYASVTRFFTGEVKYIDVAFDKALWVIDDAIPPNDRKKHMTYSGNIKACAANPTFDFAQKYGYEGEAPFTGRLYVTLNNDSTSLEMLPDSEMSLLEKTSFVATSDREAPVALDETERYATLDRELPYFMRWLLDMELPEWLKPDPRFGFKAWQDPELLEEARASASSSIVGEVIAAWRTDYTAEDGSRAGVWTGTASDLLAALHVHSASAKLALGGMSAIGFGRHLKHMCRAQHPWITAMPRDKNQGNKYLVKMT